MDTHKPKGRPKGAKNIQRPVVVEIPAACPIERGGCGSTRSEVLRIAAEDFFRGELPSGHRYTRILSRRVRCRDCGRHYIVRSYEYRAEDEPFAATGGQEGEA